MTTLRSNNASRDKRRIVAKIAAIVVLVPLLHSILSFFLGVVIFVPLGFWLTTDPSGPVLGIIWIAYIMSSVLGAATGACSLFTTTLIGLPVFLWLSRRTILTRQEAAFVGVMCAIPALIFSWVACIFLSSFAPGETSISKVFANLIFLTLYALLLGAVGGLLARYIWLPDPTP